MTRPALPEDMTGLKFLTVAEVAVIMRVSKMTVYTLVHDGELEAIRVGRSFRVPEPEVNNYLRNNFVTPKELRQTTEKPPVRALNAPRCPGRVSVCPELKSDQYLSI